MTQNVVSYSREQFINIKYFARATADLRSLQRMSPQA